MATMTAPMRKVEKQLGENFPKKVNMNLALNSKNSGMIDVRPYIKGNISNYIITLTIREKAKTPRKKTLSFSDLNEETQNSLANGKYEKVASIDDLWK